VKLKSEKISYDELSQSYIFDFENVKVGKVTSRMYPILLGKNNWNGIGYAVLDRCKLLAKEEIDPFYMVRGALAEILVDEYIQHNYKRLGIEVVTKRFTPESVNYDMFQKDAKFGGVVDIGISKPEDKRAVVEVKSKNVKDLYRISKEQNLAIEEVLQGKFLATMSNVKKLIMAYVFFSDEQENDIKNMMNTTQNVNEIYKGLNMNFQDYEYFLKSYEIDRDEMLESMEIAYDNLHRIIQSKMIHKSFFNDNEQSYLDTLLPKDIVENKNEIDFDPDDLPF